MELTPHLDKKNVATVTFVNLDERRRFAYRTPVLSLEHHRALNAKKYRDSMEQVANVTYRTLGYVAGRVMSEAGISGFRDPVSSSFNLNMLDDIQVFLDSQRDLKGFTPRGYRPPPEATTLEQSVLTSSPITRVLLQF